MLVGLSDKKYLTKWDQEDTDNLYKCEWIKTFTFEKIQNNRQRRKYYDDIYKKLLLCLPKPELAYMHKQLSTFSILTRRKRFENTIKYIVSDMRRKLFAHQYHKTQTVQNEYKKLIVKRDISFQEHRANTLCNNPVQSTQNTNAVYYPTTEILGKLPPIEIIEYAGFKLVKYDKFCGHYAAILYYPTETCKLPEIVYNTNAQIVESEVEYKFDEEVNKYIQSKANPYGDKTYNMVDISNIEQVIGGGEDAINPLDGDIF